MENHSERIRVKLYRCELSDRAICIGGQAKEFFKELFEGGFYALHFASAREAFILVLTANDGREKKQRRTNS